MSGGKRRIVRSVVAAALVTGIALVMSPGAASATQLTTPAPVEQRNSSTVGASALPTAQIEDGVVWALKVIGNTVYAGGNFSQARPAGAKAGTNLVTRTNLLAFNLQTGELTSFAPSINGQVKSLAASPDGSTLYVGGSFTTVDGKSRWNIAAFDTATGTLSTTFKPAVGGSYVNAIVATSSTVYVGGLISAGNSVARQNLMAFTTAGKLTDWAPTTDRQVDALVLTPSGDKVVVGGRFTTVNGVADRGLAALSPSDGSTFTSWIAPTLVKNGATTGKGGIYSLSADSDSVYATGWGYGGVASSNLEGAIRIDPDSGAITWMDDCLGDTYSSYSDETNVYVTGHPHNCSTIGGYPDAGATNLQHSLAFTKEVKGTVAARTATTSYANWGGQPAPALINWFPQWVTGSFTGQGQAGWSMAGSGDYLIVGGEFPYVNGKLQQGLARFARSNVATSTAGPVLSGTDWTPTASSASGVVTVSISANYDWDDLNLTHTLIRTGSDGSLASTTVQSKFWSRPTVKLRDPDVTAGVSYTYQVVASDGDGNSATSASVTVTAVGGPLPDYSKAVVNDGASLYWRMGSSGNTDIVGTNTGVLGSGVTTATTGAITDGVGYNFSGASAGRLSTTSSLTAPTDFSTEVWFKSTSQTKGGKLIGFGSAKTGSSTTNDRSLYLSDTGVLSYGTLVSGSKVTMSTTSTYTDQKWHHVLVSSSSTAGTSLYVDGVLAASSASISGGSSYTGYWRVGGDTTSGWMNKGTSDYVAGVLDEFAVYSTALSAAQAKQHYLIGIGAEAPTASFAASVSDQSVSFDATTSAAQTGATIDGYSWDFGDGATGTGATPSHTYADPGTYVVKLTVTDSRGLTATASKSIQVVGAHAAPTAAFTASGDGLTISVDGSSTTTTDGATVSSYEWDFGDGSTGTGATATHSYAAAGTYTVTLKVTDSLGVAGSTSTAVKVSHADPQAALSASVDGLTASVDGSASTATDNATLTYSWSWGDGTDAGTGATATHAYTAGGDYTIKLTITDSLGGTATASKTVTVVDPEASTVAKANFGTAVSSGWGSADIGGTWTTSGSGFSVADGSGAISLAAKDTRTAELAGISASNLEGTVQVALDKVPATKGVHFNYDLRKNDAGTYRAKLLFNADATVTLVVVKVVGTTETTLSAKTVTGLTYTAGTRLNLAFSNITDGTTSTLKAKAWVDGATEPSSWRITTTDTESALQAAGSVRVGGYAGALTNGPIGVSVDSLLVKKAD